MSAADAKVNTEDYIGESDIVGEVTKAVLAEMESSISRHQSTFDPCPTLPPHLTEVIVTTSVSTHSDEIVEPWDEKGSSEVVLKVRSDTKVFSPSLRYFDTKSRHHAGVPPGGSVLFIFGQVLSSIYDASMLSYLIGRLLEAGSPN